MLYTTEGNATSTTESPFETGSDSYMYVTVPTWLLRSLNGISAAAIVLNLLHIVFISLMPKGNRTGADNFKLFFVHLAVVQIIVRGCQLALDHEIIQRYMYETHVVCVTLGSIVHSLSVYETSLICFVTIERHLAIFNAKNYSKLFFTKHYGKIMLLVFLLWVVLYVITGVVFRGSGYSVKGSGACRLGSSHFPGLGLITSGTIIAILVVALVLYLLLIRKSVRNILCIPQLRVQGKNLRYSRQMLVTVTALVLGKLACWSPMLAAIILRPTRYHNLLTDYIGRISVYSFSLAAPVLYIITSGRYRNFVIYKLTGNISGIVPKTESRYSNSSEASINNS